MLFLLIASVMILIAFLIVLPPLWRKQPVAEPDQDQRNIAIARQRLAELKEQLQAGALTQALYDEQQLELEQALSDDLDIGGSLESQIKTSAIMQADGWQPCWFWQSLFWRVRFIGRWATISH